MRWCYDIKILLRPILCCNKGHAAGAPYNKSGGGSNFLCLPDNPQWKNYIVDHQGWTGEIAGIEYELYNSGRGRNNIFSESNNGGRPLANNPAPCAVCYVGGRSTVLMIPARTQCPDGWTTEYAGYLVSDSSSGRKRSSFVCWDEAPEVAVGGIDHDNVVIYPVEVLCGSLPCSVYPTGRELTCIVCSRWQPRKKHFTFILFFCFVQLIALQFFLAFTLFLYVSVLSSGVIKIHWWRLIAAVM